MTVPTLMASNALRSAGLTGAGFTDNGLKGPRNTLMEPPYIEIGNDGSISFACACGGGVDAPPAAAGAAEAPAVNVYMSGSLRAEFPSLSVYKEFRQAMTPEDAGQEISQKLIAKYLSNVENLYIAREMIWIVSRDAMDLYVLRARATYDLQRLIGALAATYTDTDGVLMLIRGIGKSRVPDDGRAGGGLPIVDLSEVYAISLTHLLNAIGRRLPEEPKHDAFYYFQLMMGYMANVGNTDAQRAVNYTVLQYMTLYHVLAVMEKGEPRDFFTRLQIPQDSYELVGVRTAVSTLQVKGTQLDVILMFRGQLHSVELSTTVDVTTSLPFIAVPFVRYPAIIQ